MVNKTSELFNIRSIDGRYIYTKSGDIKVIAQIYGVDDDRDIAFTSFCENMSVPFDVMICKTHIVREAYEEYFKQLLQSCIDKKYLASVLAYIDAFRKNLENLHMVTPFFILTLGKDKDILAGIEFLLTEFHIRYGILDQDDIISFLNTLAV
jgi:hypothetical protein